MNREKAAEIVKKLKEQNAQQRAAENKDNPKKGFKFPWVTLKDLALVGEKKIKFRCLPGHPDKNPDGYLTLSKQRIDLSRPTDYPYDRMWTLHPMSYIDADEAPIYLVELQDRLADLLSTVDFTDPTLFEHPEDVGHFEEAMKGLNQPWNTWEIPCVLWVDFDEKKVTKGDKSFTNRVNFRPSEKNVVGGLLQLNSGSVFRQLVDLENTVSNSDDPEEDLSENSLWSPSKGYSLYLKKEGVKYVVELADVNGAKKMPKDLLDTYGPGNEDYPNLVAKLEKFKNTNEELREACSMSWWGQWLTAKFDFEF